MANTVTKNTLTNTLNTIGIFGGTFDPIHYGHLRSALEIFEALALNEMRLIPGRQPPHREIPHASPTHRLNMVHLAIKNTPLQVDEREMSREGPSYSIDTLMSLRREYPKASLCMVVGIDAFLGLTTWFQWEKLIQLANIIVMYRHGWHFPEEGPIAELLQKHKTASPESLNKFLSGVIVTQKISTLEISASHIRQLIQMKRSPTFLLPENVYDYIQDNKLYRFDSNEVLNQEESLHV